MYPFQMAILQTIRFYNTIFTLGSPAQSHEFIL